MAKIFRSRISLCVAQANPALVTHALFDVKHRESRVSPIDEFLKRLQAVNKLAPQPSNFDAFQGQLVLLGAVAAVESYLRTLFRRLIAMDTASQNSVHDQDVSYGAALYLPKDLMPEAILERIAFVSEKSIVEALRKLLAISVQIPADLDSAISDYVRICQLRHCAVHRFGKLGVKNAISLGLADHHNLLEKPLKLDYVSLQNAIAIATGLVKTLNNFLFNEMICRIPENTWSGTYSADKALFKNYYQLFADKVSAQRTPPANALYKQFRRQHSLWLAGRPF
jgi:hypothetical protein